MDTNVLIRYFTGEPRDQFERAKAAMIAAVEAHESLFVHPAVVAEMVFVLGGPRLGIPREGQVRALKALLDLPVEVAERTAIEQATEWYAAGLAGWLDCFLAALTRNQAGAKVLSFDADFRRLPGVEIVVP